MRTSLLLRSQSLTWHWNYFRLNGNTQITCLNTSCCSAVLWHHQSGIVSLVGTLKINVVLHQKLHCKRQKGCLVNHRALRVSLGSLGCLVYRKGETRKWFWFITTISLLFCNKHGPTSTRMFRGLLPNRFKYLAPFSGCERSNLGNPSK